MSLLIILGQRFMMVPTIYASIERAGERIGMMLPSGYITQTRLIPDQPGFLVTLDTPSTPNTIPENVLRISPELTRASSGSMASSLDWRIPVMVVVLYLAALFLVSTVSLWKRSRDDYRAIRPWTFVGILSVGSGVCVGFATLFWAARIFWTGVNQTMIARSAMRFPGESTIRVQSNDLLAMGTGGLVMLLIAMTLTALPILVWVDMRLFRRIGSGDHQHATHRNVLLAKLDGFFSERTVRCACALCYGAVCFFLWTAPWSAPMLNTLWTS